MFEMHQLNGKCYLQIWYKKSSTSEKAELLNIPNCGTSCPLKKMYELYADILPTIAYETACQI